MRSRSVFGLFAGLSLIGVSIFGLERSIPSWPVWAPVVSETTVTPGPSPRTMETASPIVSIDDAAETMASPAPTAGSAGSVSVAARPPGAPPEAATPSSPSSVKPAPVVGEAQPSRGVPILMYHYIRVNPIPSDVAGYNLSVTPSDFAAQMDFLARHGFTAVTMSQVRDYVRNGAPLPPRPVALTFDDGYADAYEVARPILEQHRLTATFYVVTGFLDTPRYMSWDQVISLDRQGMEIGAHTVHHPSLPSLAVTQRRFEIDSVRTDLERHLGHAVLNFCYPGGELNAAVETTVSQSGYLSATTTRSGWAQPGDDPLRLPRLRVWGGESLREFATILGVTEEVPSRSVPLAHPPVARVLPPRVVVPRVQSTPRRLSTPSPRPTPHPTGLAAAPKPSATPERRRAT